MMDTMERDAVLLKLSERLKAHGSWCGETHMQKATYLLQDMLHVPLGFDFILYKHGPFSFELKDEITEMRADTLLTLQEQPAPYGDSLLVAPLGTQMLDCLKSDLSPYEKKIEYVAKIINNQGVKDLERLATAFYVRNTCGKSSQEEQVNQLRQFKPHITAEEARQAVQAIEGIVQEVSRMG
jgi:uncharacterized protein YwgA